ncbi:MAG: GGDEF domain-containing protein, partial [Pseudomonadota bacterium]
MMSFFRILVVVAAGLLWFAPVAIAQEPAAQTAQSSAEADEGEADGGDANPEADAGDSSNGDQETLASAATDLVDVRRDANAGDILAGGMLGALVLLAAIMMAMSVRAGAAAGRTISASLFLAAVAVYVAAQMRGPGAAQIGAPPGVAQAALMAGGCLYLALGAAATRSNVLLRALFLGGCAFAVTAGVFAVLDRPFSDLTLTIAGGLILVAGLAVLAIDALRGAPLAGAALPGGLAMALGLSALGWRAVASGPGEPLPAAPLLPLAAVSGGALLAGFATFAALGNASGVADRAAPPRRASKATKGDAVIGALKADDLMELLEYSGVGVWDWSARDDRVYATPGLRAALGDSSGAAAQDGPQSADAAPIDGGDAEVSWRSRIAPEDVETYEAFVRGAADPKDGPFDVRLRLATEDGDVAPFRFRGARAVDAGTGAPVRIAALVERDDGAPAPPPAPVSAAAPDLDALGGLPGRQALLAELTERSGAGLLLIGVDRFRAVNAALGFDGGDRLLATVASRLRSAVGEDGFAARCSGDVFAAVTAAPGFSERLMEAAEALRKRLSAPVSIGDEELIPSFSVGVAYAERMEGARPAEALLASAEAAMYEAKAEGGGRAVLYSPGAPGAAPASMSLETDLRRALERG